MRNSLIVICLSSLIGIVVTLQEVVLQKFPSMPFWIMPIGAAICFLLIGIFVEKKFEETENLKQEFITIMTHKLRTPLSRIKWAAEEIEKTNPDDAINQNLAMIKESTSKLVDLTDIMTKLSNESGTEKSSEYHKVLIAKMVEEIISNYVAQAKKRNIKINVDMDQEAVARVDIERFKSVIQIILDNAISYTPDGGSVTISEKNIGKWIYFNVKDTGIGIAKSELPHLFNKFYRSKEAKKADSSGLGIGLYLSKEIIQRQGGSIKITSAGEGCGTTVSIVLPTS